MRYRDLRIFIFAYIYIYTTMPFNNVLDYLSFKRFMSQKNNFICMRGQPRMCISHNTIGFTLQ